MTDEPSARTMEAVGIALDEDEIPGWLERWQTASDPDRAELEGDILMAAIVRNYSDPRRREELLQFREITGDEPTEEDDPR